MTSAVCTYHLQEFTCCFWRYDCWPKAPCDVEPAPKETKAPPAARKFSQHDCFRLGDLMPSLHPGKRVLGNRRGWLEALLLAKAADSECTPGLCLDGQR